MSRLIQDVLESLLSQLGETGNFNDHLSHAEVIICVKRFSLANKLPNISTITKHGQTNENAYLRSEVLQITLHSDEGD